MIKARYTLWFDAGDVCVGVYRTLDSLTIQWGHPDSLIQWIDCGEYVMYNGMNPVGLTAEQLLPFALKESDPILQ